ncbi:hypothetical protein IMZ29_18235 [Achromobacter sp. GG226]|uniref:hypothetical protein n=1 Tax=Verticiella alkaliphila TaxID=2779529 RepID=UPI001C0D8501|nr:hypothetical protein [Verticiella sp. GG226]MBU4612409.1 hypothetical protein [Verticiella sp. GG226]
MRKRLALIPLALAMSGASLPVQAASDPASPTAGMKPRNYFESLDMRTARSSLEGFLTAWRTADYQRAYFHLSSPAQRGMFQAMSEFRAESLYKPEGLGGVTALDAFRLDDEFWEDVRSMPSMAFDRSMRYAAQHLLLPVAIGAFEIVEGPASPDATRVVLDVQNDGVPKALQVAMIRQPSGRWRVDQLRWDGSDPQQKPWGLTERSPGR